MTARWAAISARAALRSAWTCFAAWARSCRASASLSAPASAAMAGPARTRQASAALRAAGSFFTRAKAEVGSFNMYRSGKRRRSEEHTSELQSPCNLVCRLLLEKKNVEDEALLRVGLGEPVADQLDHE